MRAYKLLTLITPLIISFGISSCNSGTTTTTPPQPITNPTLSNYVPSEYVYVTNRASNNVSIYGVNPDGSLTLQSIVPAGNGPWGITTTTQSYGTTNLAFVTNVSNNNVAMYNLNSQNGMPALVSTAGAGKNPTDITTDPTGRFAYVVNAGDNSISMYSIDMPGHLSPLSPATIPTESGPQNMTIDPTGHYAYVVNAGSSTISVYSINQNTGALTAFGDPINTINTQPIAIAIDSSGEYAYVINQGGFNSVSTYSINNGSLTPTSTVSTGVAPRAIAISKPYVYIINGMGNTVSMYNINSDTGTLMPLSQATVPTGQSPRNITIDTTKHYVYVTNGGDNTVSMYLISESGILVPLSSPTIATESGPQDISVWSTIPLTQHAYISNNNAVLIYSLNTQTGMLTAQTSVATGAGATGITTDKYGRYLYTTNENESTISIYNINNSTGVLTPLSPESLIVTTRYPATIQFDPTGRFAYVSTLMGNLLTYSLNEDSGMLTLESTTQSIADYADNITFSPSGQYAYVINSGTNTISVNKIDQMTGILTPVSSVTASNPRQMVIAPSGQYAYMASAADSIFVFKIDPTSGALSPLYTITTGLSSNAIAINQSGPYLYVANVLNTISTYSIDLTNGMPTLIDSQQEIGVGPNQITFDKSGQYVYVTNNENSNVSMFSLDMNNGLLTPLSTPTVSTPSLPWGIVVN